MSEICEQGYRLNRTFITKITHGIPQMSHKLTIGWFFVHLRDKSTPKSNNIAKNDETRVEVGNSYPYRVIEPN